MNDRAAYRLIQGDCLDVMPTLADGSIDAIVTDPPYGLSFMGMDWDHGFPGVPFWKEMIRVAKPGAYLLAFGGTRTYHRLGCAIEDAGWIIRDSLMWIYGTGFPKSKACLKPSHEPIVLARKPGPMAELGIDACRVAVGDEICARPPLSTNMHEGYRRSWNDNPAIRAEVEERREVAHEKRQNLGRWPANLVLQHHADCNGLCVDGCPVKALDEQAGERPGDSPNRKPRVNKGFEANFMDDAWQQSGPCQTSGYEDQASGPSRFFPTFSWSEADDFTPFLYCPKASQAERGDGNVHATVKPVALCRWLCRLITPPGGTILDPFMGSGSTLVAAVKEGFDCIGVESDPDYFKIAQRRLDAESAKTPLFAGVTNQ